MKIATHRRCILLVGLVAVTALAVACGDDGSSASDTTLVSKSSAVNTTMATDTTVATRTPSTKGKPTKSEIKLGIPIALTGPISTPSKPSAVVAQAWADWVNAEMGGINGHPVKLVIKDLKGDPATASLVSKEMVESDKVLAVIGGQDASTEAAWPKAFSDAGIFVLGLGYLPTAWVTCGPTGSSAPTCGGFKNVFTVSTQYPAYVGYQVVAAKTLGASKFGVVSCAEVPACAASAPLYPSMTASLGLAYGGLVKAALADANYTAQCLQLQSAGVDFVQIAGTSDLASRVIADCAKQGYKPIYGQSGGGVNGPDLVPISKNGVTFGGGLNGFPWYGTTPPIKQFQTVMAKYAPGQDIAQPHSTVTWAELELFRKATTTLSDNPTAAEILNLMTSNVKNETLDGLLPEPITFVKDQVGGQAVKCFWQYKLQDGNFSGSNTPSCWS